MITKNANVIKMWMEGKNARNHRGSLESRDGSLFPIC